MKKVFSFIKRELKEMSLLLKSIPASLMTFFVLSLVMMNLLANKSIDTGLSWLALDAGIIVSWLAFLTMDILVKRFGPKATTQLSVVATFINILVALMFGIASKIPGMWGESFVENGSVVNTALNNTFAGTWYVLLGSTVAFLASAVVNNFLNWGLGKLFKKSPNSFKAYAVRSYASTAVAQLVDNLVFALIVSLNFFGWSLLQCFTCALTGAIVELLCEVVFSPIGYKVSKRWEKERVGQAYIDFVKSKRLSLATQEGTVSYKNPRQDENPCQTNANTAEAGDTSIDTISTEEN